MDRIIKLLYDKKEVAEILNVPVSAVDWLTRTGRLPRRKVGRRIRFTLDDIRAYIESSKVSA